MQYPTLDEIRELSRNERLKLIEDLWETLVSNPASLPVIEDHEREIEHRLEAWRRNPDSGSNWSDVRRRISTT